MTRKAGLSRLLKYWRYMLMNLIGTFKGFDDHLDQLPTPDPMLLDYPIASEPSSLVRAYCTALIACRPAHGVDGNFLHSCGFRRFNPKFVSPSKTDLLIRMGRLFGPGLNHFQFRHMLRKCNHCRNFVFIDRLTRHQCDGPSLQTQAEGFDIVPALLTYSYSAGLTPLDVCRLFARCDGCQRIYLESTIGLHGCLGHAW